jgi:HK97 gp10 family phage protein
MKIDFNISGAEGLIKTLRQLPPELVSKRGGIIRRAASKGINVIRNQARINLRARTMSNEESTGFTAKNVISKRAKMPAGQNGERYLVTVKYADHPTSRGIYKRNKIKANDIAFMLEYGTSNQPAEPWLRPAYESKKEEVVNTAIKEVSSGIAKVVEKLSRQNK